MKTFRAGDRIRVYDGGVNFITVVKGMYATGLLEVADSRVSWHPKQCRLLKKKPKAVTITREQLDVAFINSGMTEWYGWKPFLDKAAKALGFES